MAITITNTQTGSILVVRRVNLLDCHDNIVGQYPDDSNNAVELMQNNDPRTCRSMTVAQAMKGVDTARQSPIMVVEGDL